MKCKGAKGKSGETGKRRSNKHTLCALPFPADCFSQQWTFRGEKVDQKLDYLSFAQNSEEGLDAKDGLAKDKEK
jgi:hypothetical protein